MALNGATLMQEAGNHVYLKVRIVVVFCDKLIYSEMILYIEFIFNRNRKPASCNFIIGLVHKCFLLYTVKKEIPYLFTSLMV